MANESGKHCFVKSERWRWSSRPGWGVNQRGGKPNAKQIADAASEILNQLPDANRHGLSPSSIRANIKTGIDLINR
ncbi:hypothetical protein OKW44_006910 [Paraburkholderia sp. WSM4174]